MKEAVRKFQQALRADSTYALSHLALGNTHMLRRQYDLAIDRFRRGLRFDPDNARLRRNLAVAQEIMAKSRDGR